MAAFVCSNPGDRRRSSASQRFASILLLVLVSLLTFVGKSSAGTGGSISGTVTDPSGAIVARATVTAKNLETGITQTVATDAKGFYSFPALTIGHYDLEISSAAFRPYRRTGITIDANSALTIDAVLSVGERTDAVTVEENQLQVETTSTQNGQVITARQLTTVPLNGRSYTDLLTLQPGVAPATSITSARRSDSHAPPPPRILPRQHARSGTRRRRPPACRRPNRRPERFAPA